MSEQHQTFEAEATQFLRPDGRQQTVHASLPMEVTPNYDLMRSSGHRIEMEVLTTGEVSSTISSREEDIDICITPNGPEVKQGVIDMLKRRFPT